MKIALIFYSQSGNVEFVANEIAKNLDVDLIRIEPSKAYPDKGFKKFFWGGKSAVMGEKPKLIPYKFEEDKYDKIILGYPVWAGTFAPPIKTFITENKEPLQRKQIVAFATSSGGNAEKSFAKLAQTLNKDKIDITLSLVDPLIKQTEGNQLEIKSFCDKIMANK